VSPQSATPTYTFATSATSNGGHLTWLYPNIVTRGLTLKGHGSGRTLKGRPGRATRACRLSGGYRADRQETFQGLVPAMRFQAQVNGAHHHNHEAHPILTVRRDGTERRTITIGA